MFGLSTFPRITWKSFKPFSNILCVYLIYFIYFCTLYSYYIVHFDYFIVIFIKNNNKTPTLNKQLYNWHVLNVLSSWYTVSGYIKSNQRYTAYLYNNTAIEYVNRLAIIFLLFETLHCINCYKMSIK